MIEFLLPVALMDEPFEAWRPWPERWSWLGRRHPIVIRDIRRSAGYRRMAAWQRRFRALQSDTVGAVLDVVACDDRGRARTKRRGWRSACTPAFR